jgi:hypothetical protein
MSVYVCLLPEQKQKHLKSQSQRLRIRCKLLYHLLFDLHDAIFSANIGVIIP